MTTIGPLQTLCNVPVLLNQHHVTIITNVTAKFYWQTLISKIICLPTTIKPLFHHIKDDQYIITPTYESQLQIEGLNHSINLSLTSILFLSDTPTFSIFNL